MDPTGFMHGDAAILAGGPLLSSDSDCTETDACEAASKWMSRNWVWLPSV